MENLKLSWTKVEFMAYLLIYAAQINQIETEEEKEFIGSRFDSKLLKKIYKEINSDNDYQRIQKVMVYTYQNNYLSQDLDEQQDIATKYRISSVPTMVIEENGIELDRFIGALPKKQVIQKLIA